jgi:hypothetical protein
MDEYGCSAVAQTLVVLKLAQAPAPPVVPTQAGGAGRLPRFCAPEQGSFAGGAPAHGGQLDPGHAAHEIDAAKPGDVTVKSELNCKVRQPVVDVNIAGIPAPDPVNVPNESDPVVDPS